MSEPNILSIDVGYGNTKAVWGENSSESICFKSVAPLSTIDQNSLMGIGVGALDRIQIQVNGQAYLVGPDAYLAGGSHQLDPNYVARNEYLALLRGAMYFMNKRSAKVIRKLDCLVVGLPVSNFAAHKAVLSELARQEHIIPVPLALQSTYGASITMTADKVIVMPQPMGALRSSVASHVAGPLDPSCMNLVIDPGYNTFDWLISKGYVPDLARSGSFSGGVSQILRAVSSSAGMQLGCGMIDLVECEQALDTGVLHANGKKYPFTQFSQVAQNAAEEVVDRFVNSLDMRRRFDNIILTGGGAKYYANAIRARLSEYTFTVSQDSVMQNARGFHSIGRSLFPVVV